MTGKNFSFNQCPTKSFAFFSSESHFIILQFLLQLCKPLTSSRVCITVSNSPNPSRVYFRLCKHGTCVSLQLRHTFPQGFFDSNKIHPKQGPFLPRGGLHDVRCPCSIQWIHILNKQRSLKSRLSYDYQTNGFSKSYLGTFEGRNGYVNIL